MLDEEAESEDSEVIDIAAVGQSIRVRKFGSLAGKRIEACLWPATQARAGVEVLCVLPAVVGGDDGEEGVVVGRSD
jgi:hypothetical protein